MSGIGFLPGVIDIDDEELEATLDARADAYRIERGERQTKPKFFEAVGGAIGDVAGFVGGLLGGNKGKGKGQGSGSGQAYTPSAPAEEPMTVDPLMLGLLGFSGLAAAKVASNIINNKKR